MKELPPLLKKCDVCDGEGRVQVEWPDARFKEERTSSRSCRRCRGTQEIATEVGHDILALIWWDHRFGEATS